MLVLLGVRLILFSIAGMRLCFGKNCVEHRVADITIFLLLLSSSYTEPRHFMPFYAAHTLLLARKLWVQGKLGGDTAGTGKSKWPKAYSIPYVHYIRWGRKKKEEAGYLEWWHLSSQVTVNASWGPGLLDKDEHLPAHAKELMNSLLVCVHGFAFFIELPISISEFSSCYSDSLLILLVGLRVSGCLWLGWWLLLNHDTL